MEWDQRNILIGGRQLIGCKHIMMGVLVLLYIGKWGGILAQYADKSVGLGILGS